MTTQELKQKIVEQALKARTNFTGSDSKYALSLGINAAQWSRIKNGETEKILSEANWITIARKLGVELTNSVEWKTVATPVYEFIYTQLQQCQERSMSTLLCDITDIGKSFTAKSYSKRNKNVVYVDCSQVKSKQKLIRFLAKEFGVEYTGKYADVYEDLVFYLKTLHSPLVILDEAGDLQYDAFLEIKALWNATEGACAYYMMGADGLKEKIYRSINNKKVGYAEIFSRFGKRYVKVVPVSFNDCKQLLIASAAMIIKANALAQVNVNKIIRGCMDEDGLPSLRRIYKELTKTQLV